MNYELKSVQPGSVFINAIRIFPILGLLVAILVFFVLPNPGLALSSIGQKLIATLLYTVVYSVVMSGVLAFIGFLYNVWAQNSSGIKFHLEQSE